MSTFVKLLSLRMRILCLLSMLAVVYLLQEPLISLAQGYSPPANITVVMYALRENGASTDSRCSTVNDPGGADDRFGCTAYPETDRRYPYANN